MNRKKITLNVDADIRGRHQLQQGQNTVGPSSKDTSFNVTPKSKRKKEINYQELLIERCNKLRISGDTGRNRRSHGGR